MKLRIAILTVSALAFAHSGCSMCCGPYDYHYPTMGGKHERVDPVYGRVGSILSDPLAPRGVLASADSNLEEPQRLQSSGDSDDSSMREPDSELDRIERDLEDITPLDGTDDLPKLEDLDGTSADVNRRTRLNRRPLR